MLIDSDVLTLSLWLIDVDVLTDVDVLMLSLMLVLSEALVDTCLLYTSPSPRDS